jgi:putative glutamine amidotransferase
MKRVGIVTDRRMSGGMPVHQANDEYIVAVRDGVGALPLLIPSTDVSLPAAEILAAVDGLLFTGSPSNVAPPRYGAMATDTMLLDEARDATSLPLLLAAIEAGKPVLAICRGFQELNVALGGTLHQAVHGLPGMLDHREPQGADTNVEYALAHDIAIAPNGLLARLFGMTKAQVNSLHHQGIDRLADALRVEAIAPDGLIESVSLVAPHGFLLGVQWHPEWRWSERPLSRAIFSGFGTALA